eukprot:13992246-Heterocapsa_arctica.AAC.1
MGLAPLIPALCHGNGSGAQLKTALARALVDGHTQEDGLQGAGRQPEHEAGVRRLSPQPGGRRGRPTVRVDRAHRARPSRRARRQRQWLAGGESKWPARLT